ncbi:MBL fold metallo-hydrolase [Peptostreptococcaceae bacterium AGR-M142]
MDMIKIKSRNYYIKGGTNTGLYIFKDKYCVLIDPGISNARGNRIIKFLKDNNIRPKGIIITHEHSDHYGATKRITEEFSGCKVYSSIECKKIIKDPNIYMHYTCGGESNKIFEKFFSNRNFIIEDIEELGQNIKLNDHKFEIVSLKGHSNGQIGILTEEKVFFIGDALFDEDILKKYNLPYLFSVKEQLNTLDIIKNIDFEYLVLGHSKFILNKEDALDLIELNKKNIYKYIDLAKELLEEPLTKEDLLSQIIILNELKLNYKEYYFSATTVNSLISYLIDIDYLDYSLENGKIYYYKKY